jgi:hypothetical protein
MTRAANTRQGPRRRGPAPFHETTTKNSLEAKKRSPTRSADSTASSRKQAHRSEANNLEKGNSVHSFLDKARTAFGASSALEANSRSKQFEGVAHCCDAARMIIESDDAWRDFKKFCEKNKLFKPKDIVRQDALKLILRFAIGNNDLTDKKKVSLFFRAINPYFLTGKCGYDVSKSIKAAGGFTKAASLHKRTASDDGEHKTQACAISLPKHRQSVAEVPKTSPRETTARQLDREGRFRAFLHGDIETLKLLQKDMQFEIVVEVRANFDDNVNLRILKIAHARRRPQPQPNRRGPQRR